ncbi:MAG: alanine/ornithine racemase family PLP-dependent enzyme [Bacilli bacterium]|nr:alanine/ornithine racemase family PLP-dependent enzyme [Bacilli bacterium]
MYPRIEINSGKLEFNAKRLISICKDKNITVSLVSKVLSGNKTIIERIVFSGFAHLADSRLENLENLKDINIPKMLLRLPMISEAKRVVQTTDISLNSEIATIKALNAAASEQNTIHKIILMFDLGDLREGIFYQENYLSFIQEVLTLNNINLYGIGTNLTCYGGVIPDYDKLNDLIAIKNQIESKFNIKLEIISGGNSSSLYLLEDNQIPQGINNLRIGEALFLGRETAFGKRFADLYDDAFILKAELIEVKQKPSYPIGNIHMDSFGKVPKIVDKGPMKRGILAIGKQDIYPDNLIPLGKYNIIGGSSDHIILELIDDYVIGDILSFKVNYPGLLQLMTSRYIKQIFL